MVITRSGMPMDITPYISGHSLWSTSLIFVGALLDWATLVVDPSREALPTHAIKTRQGDAEGHLPTSRPQTAEQQQAWQQLISTFYNQTKARSYACERAFSPTSIATIQTEVLQLPSYESLVQHHYYPEPMVVGSGNPHHEQENKIARRLTEYMLHLSLEEALQFLERVAILWAAQLPSDQFDQLKGSLTKNQPGYAWSDAEVRGYALYSYVVEPLER
jgi:hypothetical protein